MSHPNTKVHRRVVTGHVDGKVSVVSDERLPAHAIVNVPGFEHTFLWATSGPDAAEQRDPDLASRKSVLPTPQGSALHLFTYPPASALDAKPIDRVAAGKEFLDHLPGLAETFEKDAPGMHTTPTLDYVFVVEGQICLDLSGGRVLELSAGDIVVQQGVRHAWRNTSERPATVAFVMLGRGT